VRTRATGRSKEAARKGEVAGGRRAVKEPAGKVSRAESQKAT
jgi:hypothetical protein